MLTASVTWHENVLSSGITKLKCYSADEVSVTDAGTEQQLRWFPVGGIELAVLVASTGPGSVSVVLA